MIDEARRISNLAIGEITDATTLSDLDRIEIYFLGRNGQINELIKKLKDLPVEQKREAGRAINQTKLTIEEEIQAQRSKLQENKKIDLTIPATMPQIGSTHIVSRAIEEISAIFEKIGFERVRYPEVEWDWFSFGSLNFSDNHPARDDWETFFVSSKENSKYGAMLLTPHTSSGQVREMNRVKNPPIRMINIAKCYRRQIDVSHLTMFHQFEGLVVDRDISIVNLKGTLDYYANQFFGVGRKTRLRPYHFPFTEPSFEVDISCGVCGGSGKLANGDRCKLCKSGWLEIGGAGMVHPNVLKNGGIDPKEYSGFAFGWGVERNYMMKSIIKVPDIRLLYSTDLKILKQL